MSILQRTVIIPLLAAGAIAKHRFVAVGTSSGSVKQATGASSMIIGATGQVGAADGTSIDVTLSDIVDVDCAATISAGSYVTSDADGKAIVASTGNWLGGVAMTNGRAGSRISVLLTRTKL